MSSGRSGLSPAAFLKKYGQVPTIWAQDAQRGSTIRNTVDLTATDQEQIRVWMFAHLKMIVLLDLPSQWVKDCSFVNPNFPGLKSELQNRITAEQVERTMNQNIK